ncbi:energy transducer TonB [Sinimarinibacterium flocculans]|uniref:Protein TonB n=1 Tax=Sinimarinibacterium flocculans TaxID=985250 RepID=A0A318EBZ8_9GAMM|nr:energy transducer TonB [Sinimarinibacterium flocculans]MEC9364153.1 energy transducer TonB [Pseudomonadota bacterium]PXV69642.1 outer membrane transport energization protein TonB [Sinimarinibacterium flocculans]
MARSALAVVIAALIAVGLFWLMHLLIMGRDIGPKKDSTTAVIDFVRLKRDTQLETRTRSKPEKPPPPKKPPPPQLNVQAQAKPDMAPTPFNMPKLNLPTSITGGPFLGTFSAGDIQGDGELIPLVRIAPQYPRQALRDGVAGEVTLEITVGPDGTVKSARVKSAKPRGYFESAAVSAAYKGRFRPKVVDGTPMETTGVYTVKFNLGE